MPRHVSLQFGNVQRITQHAKGMSLRYGVIVLGNLIRFFTKKSFYHQGEWIEVRFMVLISGFNIWWGITCLVAKLIAKEEKCKFTHP